MSDHKFLSFNAFLKKSSLLSFSPLFGGFIKGILRGVRYTKSLRVLFLHRRSPSWTTLVMYSRAVFIFNEPAYCLNGRSNSFRFRLCLCPGCATSLLPRSSSRALHLFYRVQVPGRYLSSTAFKFPASPPTAVLSGKMPRARIVCLL